MELMEKFEGLRKSLRGRSSAAAAVRVKTTTSKRHESSSHSSSKSASTSQPSKDSFQNLSQNLLNALECPVCFEYMTPPITLCENGHNICQDCKPRLANCPTCRCPLIGIRNVTLENIARDVNFPCPNVEYGCNVSLQLGELSDHVAICCYRIYDCVFAKMDNCKWQGKRSRMQDHVSRYHGSKVLSSFSFINEKYLQFEVSNAECFNDCCFAIFAFDEIFMYFRKFDVSSKKLCMAIQYIGSKENSAKYQYKFKMCKNNGNQSNTVTSKTHGDNEAIDALFFSNECVTVDFDLLMGFMKGNKFVRLRKTDFCNG